MTFGHATRATICAGLLLSAGLAMPAQGQAETETVRERVVVTLPSGKRIVRFVEKQVPVKREAPAPASGSATGGDPFAGGGSDEGAGSGSGNRNSMADLDPRILEWIGWYQAGDMRADANNDGRVTAADFNAFLRLLNEDADSDDGGNDGGDTGGNGGGTNGGGSGSGGGDTGGGDTSGGTDDGGSDDAGGDTGGPETGWTELTPSSDSLVFYVAENGSDSNDGLSPSRPLRTIAEGVRKLRDGKPDWLLLRRGDTWSETLGGNWQKSGRSVSEKMVVSAYGEGPRPVLMTGSSKGLNIFKNDRRAHLAFMSLEFRPGVRYSNGGVSMASAGVQDVLFEDLLVTGYTHAITVQGNQDGMMRDIAIRRSVFLDSGGQTHAQGIYASTIDGLLIEQCIVDRNGWRPDRGRDASATIFAHNVYIQTSVDNLIYRDNFSSRAASHGLQARNGGIVDRNVFWSNPIAVMYGNEGKKSNEFPVQGSVDDNLVIEAINLNSDNGRGWGIQIQNSGGVSLARNILANSRVDGGYGIMLFTSRPADNANLMVEDNIVDDFGHNLRVDEDDVISVTLRNNVLTSTGGDWPLVELRDDGNVQGLVYDGNRYLHTAEQRSFQIDNSRVELTEWQADYDPMGGALLPAAGQSDPYMDGDATLEDYARSIGYTGIDPFIEAMRNQRKGSWDERLTPGAIRGYFKQAFTVRSGG